MSHPSFLSLNRVECIQTEDLVGSDTLKGIMGQDRFDIGEFNDSESFDVLINRPIVNGVTELTIVEADDFDPDDELITIDLTQDMDVDRVVGILVGRARYDIFFKVTSEPD